MVSDSDMRIEYDNRNALEEVPVVEEEDIGLQGEDKVSASTPFFIWVDLFLVLYRCHNPHQEHGNYL